MQRGYGGSTGVAVGLAIGLSVGVAVGLAVGSLTVGVGVGVAVGATRNETETVGVAVTSAAVAGGRVLRNTAAPASRSRATKPTTSRPTFSAGVRRSHHSMA